MPSETEREQQDKGWMVDVNMTAKLQIKMEGRR